MSLSAQTSQGTPDGPRVGDSIPDRGVRTCSKCSRPLSVGERMFYFLEAVNAPCLCRLCLHEQEQDLLSPRASGDTLMTTAPAPPTATPAGSPEPDGPHSAASVAAGRSRPSDVTNGPPRRGIHRDIADPSVAASSAGRLRVAASRFVEEDHFEEAMLCIDELASELAQNRSDLVDDLPSMNESGAFRKVIGPTLGPPHRPEDGGPSSGTSRRWEEGNDDSPLSERTLDRGRRTRLLRKLP